MDIQDGFLVERRLRKRKWNWRVHGAPEGQHFSAITSVQPDDINEKTLSVFLTTTSGSIFEYQLPKSLGMLNFTTPISLFFCQF